MYLSGGTPLVDLVECLGVGVEGTPGVSPLAENPFSTGWGASVEMIESVDFLTLLPLPLVTGVVILAIGVTGNIDSTFIWLKESEECELVFPSKFHGCASACSSK